MVAVDFDRLRDFLASLLDDCDFDGRREEAGEGWATEADEVEGLKLGEGGAGGRSRMMCLLVRGAALGRGGDDDDDNG